LKLKKEKFKGFEVILEDTILFPEGGGQVLTN
jgi:Ser-tRNA(Ala) deacylase AlaX